MSRSASLLCCMLLPACATAPPRFALPAPEVLPILSPLGFRTMAYRQWPLPVRPAATVCAGGDVMLGSDLDTVWARAAQRLTRSPTLLPSPDSLLAPLHSLFEDADLVLLNVEGAIGTGPVPTKCRRSSTSCYAFRQSPDAAGALRRVAPHAEVVGNIANNHAMDAGAAGFVTTADHLRAAGVRVVGQDTIATIVPLGTGDSVALLGFSVFSAGPDARDLPAVRRYVARAAARTPLVVVSLHVGAEGVRAQRTPVTTERFLGEDRGNPTAIAHAAIDAGASLVVGHGPHVLRAAEWRGKALAVYSLGNLVTYGPFSRVPPLDRGAILCAGLDREGRVLGADLRPTRQVRPGLAFPDPDRRADVLIDSLGVLDFPGTGARVDLGVLLRPVR